MRYWIALLSVAVVTLGFVACGDDDSPEDTRASAVGSLSENAVDAWAARGPLGLYSFLHQDVIGNCTAEGLEEALADQPKPTAWRNTKNIVFPTEDTATATVIVVQDGADVEQAWTFRLELSTRWRLTDFPGFSECTS